MAPCTQGRASLAVPARGSGGLSDGQAQLPAVDHKSPSCWVLRVTHVSRTGSSGGGTGTGGPQSLLVGLWALCSSAGGLALVDTAAPSSGTSTSALALPRSPGECSALLECRRRGYGGQPGILL